MTSLEIVIRDARPVEALAAQNPGAIVKFEGVVPPGCDAHSWYMFVVGAPLDDGYHVVDLHTGRLHTADGGAMVIAADKAVLEVHV